jgi:hypothetical protein
MQSMYYVGLGLPSNCPSTPFVGTLQNYCLGFSPSFGSVFNVELTCSLHSLQALSIGLKS